MSDETGEAVLDPFKHALAVRRYAGRRAEPISLPTRAADLRRWLDGDRNVADGPAAGVPPTNVVVTEFRALVLADLLEELAARLVPGPAFGPGRGGEELARLALELAKELQDQTFVGE